MIREASSWFRAEVSRLRKGYFQNPARVLRFTNDDLQRGE